MATKDPRELLRDFHNAISQLRDSEFPTQADCRKIANDLRDVYNYVAETTTKPSHVNAIHAISARYARREKQLTNEREALKDAQQFIEDNFDKAEQYFRAIQLGGYAAFFGLWSISNKVLADPLWPSVSLVFMLTSCSVFVIWELNKTRMLALALKRHATMNAEKLEQLLKSPMTKVPQEKSARSILTEARTTYLITSISSAVVAVAIMFWQLLVNIGHSGIGQLLGGLAKRLFG